MPPSQKSGGPVAPCSYLSPLPTSTAHAMDMFNLNKIQAWELPTLKEKNKLWLCLFSLEGVLHFLEQSDIEEWKF